MDRTGFQDLDRTWTGWTWTDGTEVEEEVVDVEGEEVEGLEAEGQEGEMVEVGGPDAGHKRGGAPVLEAPPRSAEVRELWLHELRQLPIVKGNDELLDGFRGVHRYPLDNNSVHVCPNPSCFGHHFPYVAGDRAFLCVYPLPANLPTSKLFDHFL